MVEMDKARASKGGNEYHEIWAARTSLGLIFNDSGFEALAIEGLSSEESTDVDTAATEIADVALYYDGTTFEHASREEVLQLKHSSSDSGTPITASFLSKTIRKFATHNASRKKHFGAEAVSNRLLFGFVTNRPASASLLEALELLRSGDASEDHDVEVQRIGLEAAASHSGSTTQEFFSRLQLHLGTKGLLEQKFALRRQIAALSPFNDIYGRVRLGDVKQLVRDKAGPEGEKNNLIRRTDVLDALGVDDDDLLPAPSMFEKLDHRLERPEAKLVEAAVAEGAPLILLQGNAGEGKTILAQQIAEQLAEDFETVAFDCFARGSYRRSLHHRHQPSRGLVHIINVLAMRGLCDPLIVGPEADARGVISAVHKRLASVTFGLRESGSKRGLLLIIDAADNAAMAAKEANEESFPNLLIEALDDNPIEGLTLIATCRYNRTNRISCEESAEKIGLAGFSEVQAKTLIEAKVEDASEAEIARAFSRSRGNGRVLKYLLQRWDSEVRTGTNEKATTAEDLIRAQIIASKKELRKHYSSEEIDQFLAALSRLSPPVPIEEIAAVVGLSESAIRSFVTDFHPLVEESPLGVIFPDEPTETEIREIELAESAVESLKTKLSAAQSSSMYAAQVLPQFLRLGRDLQGAWDIALSDVFPTQSSDQGKRTIRVSRIATALDLAVDQGDVDKQIILTAELGTVTNASDQGDRFLSQAPELTCLLGRKDSIERMFSWRGGWRGARHARKAIIHASWGDVPSAKSESSQTSDWLQWYYSKDGEERRREAGPRLTDVASLPLVQMLDGKIDRALEMLCQCSPDDFRRRVSAALLSLLSSVRPDTASELAEALASAALELGSEAVPILEAVLSSTLLYGRDIEIEALKAIAASLDGAKIIVGKSGLLAHQDTEFPSALFHMSRAQVLGMSPTAKRIGRAIQLRRPHHREFTSEHSFDSAAAFVVRSAAQCWSTGKPVELKNLLPEGLFGKPGSASLSDRASLESYLSKYVRKVPSSKKRNGIAKSAPFSISQEDCRDLTKRLWAAYRLAKAVEPSFFTNKQGKTEPCKAILDAWRNELGTGNGSYYSSDRSWAKSALKHFAELKFDTSDSYTEHEVEEFQRLAGSEVATISLYCLGLLTRRPEFAATAGLQAAKTASQVERDTDVDERANGYLNLCRCLAQTSREDAKVYFERGLKFAETLGVGDYEILFGILNIAAHQTGGDLPIKLSDRILNLVQANFDYDSEKAPWALLSKVAARSIGFHAFTIAAHWNDGDFASLENSLSALSCQFVLQGRLSAERAAVLHLLAQPTGWHDWSYGDALKVILENCQSENRAALAELLVERARRDNQLGGYPSLWRSQIQALSAFSDTADLIDKFCLSEMHSLSERDRDEYNARSSTPSQTEQDKSDADRKRSEESARSFLEGIIPACDLEEEASLAACWDAFSDHTKGTFYRFEMFFEVLRASTPLRARRKHLEALAKLSTIDLTWRLEAIEAAINEWSAESASVEEGRHAIAKQIVIHNALEFVERDYGFGREWRLLCSIAGGATKELVEALVSRLSIAYNDVSGTSWLGICDLLLPFGDAGSGREALVRLLSHPSAAFADEIGQGLSSNDYIPLQSEAELLSALIWHLLGETSAFSRWQAARSVSYLAKLGLDAELQLLASNVGTPNTRSLLTDDLKFSWQNAKQWLLFGVGRAALDHPQALRAFVAPLTSVLGDPEDHALYKKLASRALSALVGAGVEVPNVDKSALLNCWRHKLAPVDFGELDRLEIEEEEDDLFDFEYDFNKSEIGSFCHVFGLSEFEAHALVSREIKSWDPGARNYYDLPKYGVPRHPEFRRGDELFEAYPAQLCRHALIQAASRLSQTRPCGAYSWRGDESHPWEEWIERYDITRHDAYWLSDLTDIRPIDTLKRACIRKGGEDILIASDEILSLVGIGSALNENPTLPIYGWWTSIDDVSIRIESALLRRWGSVKVATAFRKQDRFDRWVGTYDPHRPSPARMKSNADKVREAFDQWILDEDDYTQVDQYDRYASTSANKRPRLKPSLSAELGLVESEAFGREWSATSGGIALTSEAWGGYRYEGGGPQSSSANRLLANTTWLQAVLEERDQSILLQISLSKYIKGSHWSDEPSRHIQDEVLLLVAPTGQIRVV